MSLKPIGRVLKATTLSLAMALGVTACSNDYTVSYVYMATSKALPHGLINAYQVDYQSGFLLPLADSPVDAGGRDTLGMVVAPNNLALYTVNNYDSDVTQFDIGTDGKLYPESTYNISGSLPTAAAIDASGKFLFVTFTYQTNFNGTELYTPANPGPGGISIFPINPDNSLGKPLTFPLGGTTVNAIPVGRNPVAITTVTNGSGSYVYVIDQDSGLTNPAYLLGFTENTTSTGLTLTPMPGVTIVPGNAPSTGFPSGPNPSGILADKSGTHLYVTDQTLNQVYTYTLTNGVPGSPVTTTTDGQPMGMSFDLTGKYLYMAAYAANAIDIYTIGANGLPVRSTVSASVQAGTGPTCVTVSGAPSNANPTHAEYLYTSNQLSGTLTGEQVNQADGSLDQIQGTPFSGSPLPTCALTVPAYPIR